MSKLPKYSKCFEVGMMYLMLHEEFRDRAIVDCESLYVSKEGDVVVGCPGGWYGFGATRDLDNLPVDYIAGGGLLALVLGFKDIVSLQTWTKENSLFWGNRQGPNLLSRSIAYGVDKDLTLKHIGEHWLQVGERIREFTYAIS